MFDSLVDFVALMKEMKLDGIAIQITNTYTRHVCALGYCSPNP